MGKRLLLVDDQPQILKFVELGLKLRGYDVTSVRSGEAALKELQSGIPDLILLDIIMSNMSGLEVLKKLRAFPRIPVIVYSANSDKLAEAMRLGANDFIAKPFDVDELVNKIEALLNL